jgi:hypothetical protein
MATFHIDVDTRPLAAGLDGVARHVDATTAAVVAMQTATVLAERKATRDVCAKIDDGFHTLIVSQISQKAARARAVMDSKLQQLVQFGDFLSRLKGQMERDYHRIRSRYMATFNALDAAMAQRVAELDRPAYDLGQRSFPRLEQREFASAGAALVQQSEGLTTAQAVSVARTRQVTMRALHAMSSLVSRGVELRHRLESAVAKERATTPTTIAVPAMFVEGEAVVRPGPWRRTLVPDLLTGGDAQRQYIEQSMVMLPTRGVTEAERERVLSIARARLGRLAVDSRVREMVVRLLEEQRWQRFAGET